MAKLATVALEHANGRKTRLAEREKQDLRMRLAAVEEAEAEQADMLMELTANVEELTKAVRGRKRTVAIVAWASLVLSLASLSLSALLYFK